MVKNIYKKFFVVVLFLLTAYNSNVYSQDLDKTNKDDPFVDRFDKRLDILQIEEDKNKEAIRHLLEDLQDLNGPNDNPKKENYTNPIELNIANTKLTIGGFVQSDFIYDFNVSSMGGSFIPSSIPIKSLLDPKLTFSYLQSRFTLTSQSNTSIGILKTLFEYDLFSDGMSPGFHVRHAWGELGSFGVGQYWSAFMDIDVFPNILDYQGPNAMVFVRQVQLRYTHKIGKNFKIALSIEKPYSDVQQAAEYQNKSLVPDFALHLRYAGTRGHMQLAGILHSVRYQNNSTKINSTGWGLNLTGLYNIGTELNDSIMFQATYGNGIARYFNDISGLNYDGFVNKPNDKIELDLLPVWSIMAFYNHSWSSKFSSALGWGYLNLENNKLQMDNAFNNSHYGVANIIYYPIDPIKVGLEYLYGMLMDKHKDSSTNNRLQLSIMYKF